MPQPNGIPRLDLDHFNVAERQAKLDTYRKKFDETVFHGAF